MYFRKPNKKADELCKLINGKKNNLIKNRIMKNNFYVTFRITLDMIIFLHPMNEIIAQSSKKNIKQSMIVLLFLPLILCFSMKKD